MRLAVSNLAWPADRLPQVLPALRDSGIAGVEIAPTAIWPEAPAVSAAQIAGLRSMLDDHGLKVSGLQSLLYGHPEYQLMDRFCWAAMRDHLRAVVDLAGELAASVAVFGSPKNRLQGDLGDAAADALATEFFGTLLPDLEAAGVVLTLEPNAPAYGADYLTHYEDVVRLSDRIGSPWVGPQVDTGCLTLVDDDPAAAVRLRRPAHVHVSVPQLGPPPGDIDHAAVAQSLRDTGYDRWVVLEMLPNGEEPQDVAVASARWLRRIYGSTP